MSQSAASLHYGGAGSAASMRLTVLSAVLWAVGVLTIRFAAPFGLFSPSFSLALMLATIPLAWLTVDLAIRVAGQNAPLPWVAAMVSMPALLLDGVAIMWAPGLYGPAAMPLRAEAAWLLWFMGVSMAVALWRQMRQTAQAD